MLEPESGLLPCIFWILIWCKDKSTIILGIIDANLSVLHQLPLTRQSIIRKSCKFFEKETIRKYPTIKNFGRFNHFNIYSNSVSQYPVGRESDKITPAFNHKTFLPARDESFFVCTLVVDPDRFGWGTYCSKTKNLRKWYVHWLSSRQQKSVPFLSILLQVPKES